MGALLLAVTSVVVGAGVGSSGADGNEAPGAPTAARSLTAGTAHTCAIDSTGSVRCWGRNASGQLGLGDIAPRGDGPNEMGIELAPVALGTGRTATAITAGGDHTCALLDNGAVKCWGKGSAGQLGLGGNATRGAAPNEMGDNLPTVALGTGRTATGITAGGEHTCALLDDDTVKCWGNNGNGQLGQGDTATRGDGPGEMGDNLPTVALGTGRTATVITAGNEHTCALLDNDTVKCWGRNFWGGLGLGDTATRGAAPNEMGDNLPAVALGTGRTATAITAGVGHTCALLDNDTVKCWGRGLNGPLGQGDSNDRGDGPGEMGDNLPAVALGTGRTAAAVAAGSDSETCALLDDATVKCWGNNGNGQLGQGDTASRGDGPGEMGDNLPTVDLGTGRTAAAVTVGQSYTCVILDDATVRCWGANDIGQLGAASKIQRGDQPGETGDLLVIAVMLGPGVAGRAWSTNGQQVAGALVAALRTSDFAVIGGGAATATGVFGFAVASGSYYVYLIDPTGVSEPRFLGAPSTVGVTTGTTIIDPLLTARLGAIAGTVTETGTGNPVAGAYVLTLTAGGAFEASTTADAAGQFTLSGLTPGPHHLIYIDRTGNHAVRFHPSAVSIGAATPVAVTAGAVAVGDGNVPAQVPVGTGNAVTGRVTDSASGAPVVGGVVAALRADDLSFARAARTNSTGGYSLNLAAGGYTLVFIDASGRHHVEWYQDAVDVGAAQTVTAPGTANAGLVPTPIGDISGTVTHAGAPAGAAWVLAIGPSGVAGGAVTDGAGTYRIAGLSPGNYRAAVVHPPSGRYEYWEDGTGYEDGTVFQVLGGADVPLDADL